MRPLRRPALSFPSYFLSLLFFHYYKGIFSLDILYNFDAKVSF